MSRDIEKRPERRNRSVVITSTFFTPIWSRDNASSMYRENIENSVRKIIELGVPFVVPSGNHAVDGHLLVNCLPQILEADDFPMIVVGSAG